MSLHDKKRLGKKDKKGWCCDKILVHFKEFGPIKQIQIIFLLIESKTNMDKKIRCAIFSTFINH
jgi:hypothetical protein